VESPVELPEGVARRVREAASAVVLTGAGVSQESGLGTFRGPGGLWEEFRPEELATPSAFRRAPETVWRWYAERWRWMAAAQPNPAHRALVRWRELFASFTLVTQNIDRLHQRAGSPEVLELHGTLALARCSDCQRRVEMDAALALPGEPPRCPCGGLYRPDVVWFGELLPQEAMERATSACRRCDLFLAVGTSATVFPAAGLIEVARDAGACVVEVNPEETAVSRLAHLRLAAAAGAALPALTEAIAAWRSRRS
jgi:NAD-dependent deacetylase